MTKDKVTIGHLLAFFTVLIWGTTFISTKILLRDFSPIELLFFRFSIAVIALSLVYPHRFKVTDRKHEWYFALSGLCGVTLYFLLENIALTYTLVSNVGVIISVAPFFTAIFAHLFLDGEKFRPQFFLGFAFAILGIFLISFNGSMALKLNHLGDILTILAAVVWAAYSVLIKKISSFHYPTILSTRRVFLYGLIFMIPALFIFNFRWNFNGLARFAHLSNLLNILYLGLGASALCFVTWNWAVKILGAVKTSAYIYMGPVITIVTSAIVLKEKITWITLAGTALTLVGLFISENKVNLKIMSKSENKSMKPLLKDEMEDTISR
jgi:drug/metabolite transporter (DMT)-like permease